MCFWSKPEVARSLLQNDQTMPMDLFQRALEESVPYGRALCLAGGGEFMMDRLREERFRILGDTLRNHPEIMLYQTTNGSLLSADNLQFLNGVKKVGFTLSIDSMDALTYASIRRPGGLSQVQHIIRTLRIQLHELGLEEIHLRLNMVLMKRNIFSLPNVLRFAKEIEAVVFVDHPQGFGPDDLHQESLFRFPAFSNSFLEKCRSLAEILNVEFQTPPPFAIRPPEIENYFDSLKDKQLSCYQLDKEGPIQVSPNGDVSVCCQNLIFGNLHQQSFKEVFYSPRYMEFRQAIAKGQPLSPCDHCRHLYRNAPFLYESSVYNMDIPPESRDLDPEPDFEQKGFFDWLNELTEKQLRNHMHEHYRYNAKHLATVGIAGDLESFDRQKQLNETYLSWIQKKQRIVICPAGKQTAWLLKHTLLSHVEILAIADRNAALHDRPFHGHRVIAPSNILVLKPDVLLIASSIHKKVISQELQHLEQAGIQVSVL